MPLNPFRPTCLPFLPFLNTFNACKAKNLATPGLCHSWPNFCVPGKRGFHRHWLPTNLLSLYNYKLLRFLEQQNLLSKQKLVYSNCPKSKRLDFGAFRNGSVAICVRFQNLNHILFGLFRFRTKRPKTERSVLDYN